jgi:hypothetical protein
MIRKTDAVYIVIADGDDILLPGWLTPQIDLLENCPQIVATYGKMRHVDANLKDLGRIQGGSFSRFVLPFVNYVSQGGIIMRRKAVLDAGCYLETGLGNRSLGADLFLWYRLAMIGDLVFINEYRYLYRQHGDQSTKGSNSQERMRSAHQYMQDWTIEHNRSAYERIVSGTGEFSEKELRSVILLLGIIAKRMHNARMPYKQLIDAAEMIDPYDHGIISQRIVMLEQEGAFRQCLEECDKMIERFSNDLFCSMNALRIKAQLLDRIGSREEALSVKSKADLFQQQFDEFDWNQAIATTGLHVHP